MATFYSPFVHLLFGLVCVTAIEHNPIYQQFVDWAETTTYPQSICEQKDVVFYGDIKEVLMMNFASYCWDALEECKDCKFATFIASQGTCILLGSVNTTMEISSSAAATSRVKECTFVAKDDFEFNKFMTDIMDRNRNLPCKLYEKHIMCAGRIASQHSSYDPTLDGTCIFPIIEATFQNPTSYDHDKGSWGIDPRHEAALLQSIDHSNITLCQEQCNANPQCLVYTSKFDAITEIETCYLYQDNYPYAPILTPDPGSQTGFKYCNIASTDLSLWVNINIHKSISNNPFYREPPIGVQCHGMDVPHHCRRLPVDRMVALPLTKKGRCLAEPKVEDLIDNQFCHFPENTTEVTSQDLCMYCVVGDRESRTTTGLLTREWRTCRVKCNNGNIVSCNC